MGSPASRKLGSSAGLGSAETGNEDCCLGESCSGGSDGLSSKRVIKSILSLFAGRRSRPTTDQGRGNQRQEQFVVAGDGVAARLLSFAAVRRSSGAPYYILQRTVVLNKVEVGGSDGAKRNAKVAHDRHSFQENLWEQNGRTPIQIDAAGLHLFHERAEEAEVEVSGGADSEMDGDRDAEFVGGDQDAGVCVRDVDHRVMEELAGGFAVPEAGAHGDFRDLVEILAGLRGHA